ncbi:MAG: ABC transporter ATP-binding protein [Armatimonadota bacterium]
MSELIYAIESCDLTKRYGHQTAVDSLNLKVPAGSVFAFLGRNGAGKTTTIQMLMDLLPRTSGSAKLLGLDSVKKSRQIKSRIGYVADGQQMYDWMKVDEIIWFCKGFYPDWDDALAEEHKTRLGLDGKKKVRELSRGMKAKLGLLLALAHHPELLILDEPTAGLDVVVRRDFLGEVIEMIQQQGRTVFFSTHIVHEVERVADWVGILDHGHMVWCSPLEELKNGVQRVVLSFSEQPAELASLPGVLECDQTGRQAVLTVKSSPELLERLRALQPMEMDVQQMSLEDIFVALVGGPEEEQ